MIQRMRINMQIEIEVITLCLLVVSIFSTLETFSTTTSGLEFVDYKFLVISKFFNQLIIILSFHDKHIMWKWLDL